MSEPKTTTADQLPFTCPNCGKDFGWGDGSAPIFLGVVNSLPFSNEPTPCCGYRISGTIDRDLVMTLRETLPNKDTIKLAEDTDVNPAH